LIRALLSIALLLLPGLATAQVGTPVASGATVTIDAHGECREVTNPGTGTRMVFTGTAAEWQSFRDNPSGLTIAKCPPTMTFINYYADSATADSFTFDDVSIGAPASDRVLILGILAADGGWPGGERADSVTVNGVAATKQTSYLSASVKYHFFTLAAPTGTTADIVVNWSGDIETCGLVIYRAAGLNSEVPEDDSGYWKASGTGTTFTDVSVPEDGFIIGMMGAGGMADITVSGLDEDYETPGTGSKIHASSRIFTSAQTPAITYSWSGSHAFARHAASWR
jgi:hypothetical protein